jgi:NAD(P)-dependent dehydrogenase (short-subunit alcohol dehydrogenase family)
VAKNYPMNRLGRPEEVAEAVVWMCTRATYMLGSTLSLDGGALA